MSEVLIGLCLLAVQLVGIPGCDISCGGALTTLEWQGVLLLQIGRLDWHEAGVLDLHRIVDPRARARLFGALRHGFSALTVRYLPRSCWSMKTTNISCL